MLQRGEPLPTLPSVAEYLARLPAGIHSYPQAVVKGSVLRNSFDWLPDPKPRSGVREFDRLLEEPPLVTDWVPQTYHCVWILTIYETNFSRAGGLAEFDEWMYARNRQLFRGPLYRALFLAVSPKRLVAGAADRWSKFRRGIELTRDRADDESGRWHLHYPPHLMESHTLRAMPLMIRAALEEAGGYSVKTTWAEESPTTAWFEASWRTRKGFF